MCGLLGMVAPPGERTNVTPSQVIAMRDAMAHRGPDDAGFVEHRNVFFAHRRLSVIDPQRGVQPMWSPDRRHLLIYNGELYNDAELRRELEREHRVVYQTSCDTETLLHALIVWGDAALNRLRGMFAFAWYDFVENRLLLARDPLGIKPLYYALVQREAVVSSQPGAILGHPHMRGEPDFVTVSAYLSTIRTTLGRRTLFAGVQTVLPGECVEVRFVDGEPAVRCREYWTEPACERDDLTFDEAAALVREAVIDSVQAHLRSDVPRCLLLSGGLDSAILATVCRDLGARDVLQTWCAADASDFGEDRRYAALMARHLGARHHEVSVDAGSFVGAWFELIARNGLPLSTPNETAIYAVARDLKPHATVALSGEGADELFGGYAMPVLCGLDAIHAAAGAGSDEAAHRRYLCELAAQYGGESLGSEVDHYLRCNCWVHPSRKAGILTEGAMAIIDGDRALFDEAAAQFGRADELAIDPAQRLLRVHRRINLTGLLGRLDTATMAASVEGRTPLADVRLAELAASLPFAFKFRAPVAEDGGWSSAAQTLARGRIETKRVLRAAFAKDLPVAVMVRSKASFPLPFQKWLAPLVDRIAMCSAIGLFIRPEVIPALRADPVGNWLALWPIANMALWFEQRWGCGLESGELVIPGVQTTGVMGDALSGIG